MEQEQVIHRIKETGERILPSGTSLWLYGPQTRGDAHVDSDYDVLILLDKNRITSENHDRYAYPLREFGRTIWTAINPHIYTRKDWNPWFFSPFNKNVEHDKVILI